MIDIHTHVIPGIDDGSDSMDSSLELLLMSAESGVDGVVATPHCNVPDEFDNYASPELERLFQRLESEVRRVELPVKLYRGMEIFATPDLPELLQQGRVLTLNGTRYFLTEFSFNEDPDFCRRILRDCVRLGFHPIIAHPERYFFIQEEPEIAYEWCVAGYGLQINKGSYLGRFGDGPQRTADLLTDHGLAACVGSDAHHPAWRSTHMTEVSEYLTEVFGEGYTHLLLTENPARILRGQEMLGYEPIPF